MSKSRIDYENLIRNSILFSLDRNIQATAYRREALKMVEYLYLYMYSINPEKYKEFGLEITETANRCIKNHVPEAGDFLNYFNAAIAKEYRKALAQKQLVEHHAGVHIPEDDMRIIRKYMKYAKYRGYCELDNEAVDTLAEATGIAKERIIDCIVHYQGTYSISDTYTTDNGTEASLFDLISCIKHDAETVVEYEAAQDFLEHINEVFQTRQARQKHLLSKLLTAKVAGRLSEDQRLLRYAQQLDFFDDGIYAKSHRMGSAVTAREIGNTLGISEQSVSRTYKAFISLI